MLKGLGFRLAAACLVAGLVTATSPGADAAGVGW